MKIYTINLANCQYGTVKVQAKDDDEAWRKVVEMVRGGRVSWNSEELVEFDINDVRSCYED